MNGFSYRGISNTTKEGDPCSYPLSNVVSLHGQRCLSESCGVAARAGPGAVSPGPVGATLGHSCGLRRSERVLARVGHSRGTRGEQGLRQSPTEEGAFVEVHFSWRSLRHHSSEINIGLDTSGRVRGTDSFHPQHPPRAAQLSAKRDPVPMVFATGNEGMGVRARRPQLHRKRRRGPLRPPSRVLRPELHDGATHRQGSPWAFWDAHPAGCVLDFVTKPTHRPLGMLHL